MENETTKVLEIIHRTLTDSSLIWDTNCFSTEIGKAECKGRRLGLEFAARVVMGHLEMARH